MLNKEMLFFIHIWEVIIFIFIFWKGKTNLISIFEHFLVTQNMFLNHRA